MIEIIFPAGMLLPELNALVTHLEQADGPLSGMRTEGRANYLKFDDLVPKRVPFAVIRPDSEGKPDAGAELICSATIFIGGQETKVTAWRPERA
jgi:hypothetical protein